MITAALSLVKVILFGGIEEVCFHEKTWGVRQVDKAAMILV